MNHRDAWKFGEAFGMALAVIFAIAVAWYSWYLIFKGVREYFDNRYQLQDERVVEPTGEGLMT